MRAEFEEKMESLNGCSECDAMVNSSIATSKAVFASYDPIRRRR